MEKDSKIYALILQGRRYDHATLEGCEVHANEHVEQVQKGSDIQHDVSLIHRVDGDGWTVLSNNIPIGSVTEIFLLD